jgi:hypothetical protein
VRVARPPALPGDRAQPVAPVALEAGVRAGLGEDAVEHEVEQLGGSWIAENALVTVRRFGRLSR